MIPLVTAGLFVGYTLVYAAVANGGKLAARPWDALRVDAYNLSGTPGGAAAPAHQSTTDRVLSIGGKILRIAGLLP